MLSRLAPLLLLAAIVLPGRAPTATPATRQAESPDQLINWYYAAVFGTGIYSAGDRSVGVLQLPFAYTWRPPSAERWGIKLTLPVTLGFYDFDLGDIADADLPESASTISVLPGVELEMQVLDNWRLRPFAALGKGWELDGASSALISHLGVKSQLTFPMGRGYFVLGNTLSHAAYDADNQPRQPLIRFITGLNFAFPTNGEIAGRPADFGIHLIHYLYATELNFPLAEDLDNSSRSEYELAFSVSTRRALSYSALGQSLFRVDRVGLAFRVGDEVTGIRLFLSLPY